jgi:Family of unknown function (DUF6978)
MSDLSLTQLEADALIAMEKHRTDETTYVFPVTGALTVTLQSPDRRETFLLDITRGRIDLKKATFQNRGRQVFVLVRLDIAGPPHWNPDGEEVPCPHLHVYREGFGDKWAIPVPLPYFPRTADLFATLDDFYRFCSVTRPPMIERGLFS